MMTFSDIRLNQILVAYLTFLKYSRLGNAVYSLGASLLKKNYPLLSLYLRCILHQPNTAGIMNKNKKKLFHFPR